MKKSFKVKQFVENKTLARNQLKHDFALTINSSNS